MDTDSSEEEEEEVEQVRIPLGHRPIVFATPGGRDLAQKALSHLGWQQGVCSFATFSNGEIASKVEETVTNHDVFVFYARDDCQAEVNFSIMQLMAFLAALKGESPHRLTVVLPCLDYARQDRRLRAGEGIPAKFLLRGLKTAGADRFLTIDLHNEAEAGFTPANTVLDELSSRKYMADFLRQNVEGFNTETSAVCATKGGGMALSRRMAAELGTGLLVADQVRTKAAGDGQLKIISSVPASQVQTVIVVDDMFDTCGSLLQVCKALNKFVPQAKLYAVASHGYFSGKADQAIKEAVQTCNLQWVGVTNSVAQAGSFKRLQAAGLDDRLKIVDISRMLAGSVMRIYMGASVNLPKFREIGPGDPDPVLASMGGSVVAAAGSPLFGPRASPPLKRQNTGDGPMPTPMEL